MHSRPIYIYKHAIIQKLIIKTYEIPFPWLVPLCHYSNIKVWHNYSTLKGWLVVHQITSSQRKTTSLISESGGWRDEARARPAQEGRAGAHLHQRQHGQAAVVGHHHTRGKRRQLLWIPAQDVAAEQQEGYHVSGMERERGDEGREGRRGKRRQLLWIPAQDVAAEQQERHHVSGWALVWLNCLFAIVAKAC